MGAPDTHKGSHLEATEIAGICDSWERLSSKIRMFQYIVFTPIPFVLRTLEGYQDLPLVNGRTERDCSISLG